MINDYLEQLRNASKLKKKNLILEAEKIGIIGEDPQKYWNKNKITSKIPIKNPDLTIKMVDIAFNLIYTREFKIQIEKLLKNNLIKPSFSSHRS